MPTIGRFYDGIRDAFMSLPSEPQIDTPRQMKGDVGANKLTVLKNREDIATYGPDFLVV